MKLHAKYLCQRFVRKLSSGHSGRQDLQDNRLTTHLRRGLVMVAAFLRLFFLFAFFEPSEVILNEERSVELAHRHVMIA